MAKSRARAASLIADGCVTVNGKAEMSPAYMLKDTDTVGVTDSLRYVGRGGLKLEAAISAFGIDPSSCVCCDIGASTGGFTDCLLQNGAEKVYAVDSGHGQLDTVLLGDPRVVDLEGVNARLPLSGHVPEKCDMVVCDVSFISQTYILPNAAELLKDGGHYIGLIKPQFECGPKSIGKGGIVRSAEARKAAVMKVLERAAECFLEPCGLIESPITGGDGNIEYLFCAEKTNCPGSADKRISERSVAEVVNGKKNQ